MIINCSRSLPNYQWWMAIKVYVLMCNDDVIIEQSRLCNMDYINVVCNIITLSSFVPTNVLYCSLLILIRLIHINSLEARLQVA